MNNIITLSPSYLVLSIPSLSYSLNWTIFKVYHFIHKYISMYS